MASPVKLSPLALPSNSVMAVAPLAQAEMVPPVPAKRNCAGPAPATKPVPKVQVEAVMVGHSVV